MVFELLFVNSLLRWKDIEKQGQSRMEKIDTHYKKTNLKI